MSKVSRFAMCLVALFVSVYTTMDVLLHISSFNEVSLLSITTIVTGLLLIVLMSALWFLIEWHDSFN